MPGRVELARVRAATEARARAALSAHETALLLGRFDRRAPDLYAALAELYGQDHPLDELLDHLMRLVLTAVVSRPAPLRARDQLREVDPEWFLDESMVGYVAYADRFAGTLQGVRGRLDHLDELGVTYLHLLPLLQPREGPNDGGYAVADHRSVDTRLGTMQDLEALSADLHARDMNLCVDLVVNHTAREHPWARAAVEGDPAYRDFYLLFPDRTEPDRYESSLLEVFPEFAPRNFTWDDDAGAWVWTTFYPFQWDLNHRNPAVFAALLETMLHLANRGVDVLRLDAVPFLWKREGTNCQNLPEVHLLLQAWRALTAIAAPSLVFKAEAIVPPGELVPYLGAPVGGGDPRSPIARTRRECDLAYHNQLMVASWSSLATRDARLMVQALGRMGTPPHDTTWVTYVRCHDDIGWAVDDQDADAVGADGHGHRRFLADFYAGQFPLSFAEGAKFQEDPRTGDARTSGSTAALCGIQQAIGTGDPLLLDQAIRRLLLLYGVAYGFGGIPLVWMGDELALPNDLGWMADPERRLDNRWLHRPTMDWDAAGKRHDEGTVEGRVFRGLARLGHVRSGLPELRGGAHPRPVQTGNDRVFGWLREHPMTGRLLGLANYSDVDEDVSDAVLEHLVDRSRWALVVDALDDTGGELAADGRVGLDRLQVRWLVLR